MKIYYLNKLSKIEYTSLVKHSIKQQDNIDIVVKDICNDVKVRGDIALKDYCLKFDNVKINNFIVTESEYKSSKIIDRELLNAINIAKRNIEKFHKSQKIKSQIIETSKGITCWRESRPIEKVGLYIPSGSTPLPSTVLMLGIPAKIAGCKEIILCSPPNKNGNVDPVVLFTAKHIGIDKIFKIGGAQAIAAMAYGTATIPKVDKIFGPGNKFVTAAKKYVSNDIDGASIDLIAGPSEVLIIADESANPEIVAIDMISQAEHDKDAQAILVTTSESLAKQVENILSKITSEFSRSSFIQESLEKSFIMVADTINSAIEFCNNYAPEHLIINTIKAKDVTKHINNAGSVFVGKNAPVTAGDYASGTNHTLPTNQTARFSSGLSLESFQKNITFQSITKDGLKNISQTLTTFANAEGLEAHAQAVSKRIKLKD